MAERDIDARGHRCPVPALRLRRALQEAGPGDLVRLIADDPLARIDVPHLAASLGATIESREEAAGVLTFCVRKSAA